MAVSRMDVGKLVCVRIEPRKEFLLKTVSHRLLARTIGSSVPSIGDWRSMKQRSVQRYKTLLASPLSDALFDSFVFFGREVRGVGYVGETHCEVYEVSLMD
jgi:hypothetical protein